MSENLSNQDKTNFLKRDWNDALRKVGGLAVRAAFLGFVIAMAFAVYRLGEIYGQPELYRALVAGACALGVFGHGVALTQQDSNASRMLHGIALSVWLVLSLFLASLYMFASSPQLASKLPAVMIELGAYVYALAFGIGLFTSTLSLVVPAVSNRQIFDATHPTLGAAVARFGEPLFIVLAVGVSSFHLFSFGNNVAKTDLFSTVMAMVIADLAFIVAEKKVLKELKARNETGREDRFDLVMWGLFAIAVMVYLLFVNMFSVRYTAGTLNPNDPMLKTIIDLYGVSPSLLIASGVVLALVTAFVDIRPSGTKTKSGDRFLVRVAKSLNQAAQDWGDVKAALPSRQGQKALPTPTVVMGSDGNETKPVEAEIINDTAGDGLPQEIKS